jgi:hypothetical protein
MKEYLSRVMHPMGTSTIGMDMNFLLHIIGTYNLCPSILKGDKKEQWRRSMRDTRSSHPPTPPFHI